jgi:hypothetical protein
MGEKDLNVVAFCGLCCLDCHGHTGKIADLSRDFRKELRQAKYGKFAEAISRMPMGKLFANYQQCYDLLGAMVKFRCKKGGRSWGGQPFCKIRNCCQAKKILGCWECTEDPARCEKLTFLAPVHREAHLKNIRILQKKGIDDFVSGKRNW